MQVFYVNIGGGEPTVRPDFWELVDYATAHPSASSSRLTASRSPRRWPGASPDSDYVDVQISLDGATADGQRCGPRDRLIRDGAGRDAQPRRRGFAGFKISVVVTRHNAGQLDAFKALADRFGAQLRLTRLRPSGRGADVWDELHPTAQQQRDLYDWLVARGEQVLTGDSFFHLAAFGQSLPGLNLCGAGRVVCLIDPVGDVYACPFAIHDNFLAGNVRGPGGFAAVWQQAPLFAELRQPQGGGACTSCSAYDSCRGGCMAAKFFTGLPLDGPDPECVQGHGERALLAHAGVPAPRPSGDHSHRARAERPAGPVQPPVPVPVSIGLRPRLRASRGAAAGSRV